MKNTHNEMDDELFKSIFADTRFTIYSMSSILSGALSGFLLTNNVGISLILILVSIILIVMLTNRVVELTDKTVI